MPETPTETEAPPAFIIDLDGLPIALDEQAARHVRDAITTWLCDLRHERLGIKALL